MEQVRSEMAAKRVLMLYRLNKAAFDYIVGEIHAKFMTSKVTGYLFCVSSLLLGPERFA